MCRGLLQILRHPLNVAPALDLGVLVPGTYEAQPVIRPGRCSGPSGAKSGIGHREAINGRRGRQSAVTLSALSMSNLCVSSAYVDTRHGELVRSLIRYPPASEEKK
ncbi:hypothetical protein GCM10009872_48220 [Actinopolymorpha rutila]